MAHYVDKVCNHCNQTYQVLYKQRNKRRYCSRKCVNEAQTGEGNPAFGKTYQTKESDPAWASKISKCCKGINVGSSNGMKRADARVKASNTRREKMKDPEFRKVFSDGTRRAWANGKFDGVRVGQCEWFAYTKNDGTEIKVQGTWELAFASWADKNNLNFDTHRGVLKYQDANGDIRTYYPDFFVHDWQSWVDVKNDYYYNLQREKLASVERCNPGEKLRILRKKDLLSLGVELR